MALRGVLDAVEARFVANGGKATFKLGGENILANDAPPRIVWVPRGGPFGPVDKGGSNPRPLKTRNLRVFAHVWAEDADAADDLVNRLSAAVHTAASGSVEFGGEEWPVQNEQLAVKGCVVLVDFTFRVPVTAPAHATATVSTAPQTPEIQS